MDTQNKFDAIVIGSGMGSLTAASLLAKCKNLKVLVLEQHYTIGGQTHAFFRKNKVEFDVGVHYIGAMDRGDSKKILDFITDGKTQWQKMPDEFEKFAYPDLEFSVPSNKKEYQKRLIELFPEEKDSILKYFNDIKIAGKWYSAALLEDTFPFFLRPFFKFSFSRKGKIANITTSEYLNQNFKNEKLKALLASQWGDYGVPPGESPFGMHALVVAHYWRGAWYPVGGAKTIAQAIVPIIEKHGGKVLKRRAVSKILVKNNKAYGVATHLSNSPNKTTEEFYAPLVISGAGAIETYLNLVPENIKIPFKDELKNMTGLSIVSIYLTLKESPEKLGIKGENHWVFETYNHNELEDENGFSKGYYLSFPSLKNSQAHGHTVDILTLMNYDKFKQWQESSWKNRTEDYEAFKKEIADNYIAKVNKRIPGFSELVETVEVSTPLTIEHFLKREKGLFYGVPMTTKRLFKPWTFAKLPVKNLFLTGSDVMTPGVIGAMMGGVKTVGSIMGPFGLLKVMKNFK